MEIARTKTKRSIHDPTYLKGKWDRITTAIIVQMILDTSVVSVNKKGTKTYAQVRAGRPV